MAEFKKHMMYGDGKSKMANTKKQHLNLKAKGWGHTKPKSSSPLEINQALVAGARGSNYQYGGETSLSAGEWKGNLMTQPIMDAMLGDKLSEEEKKNKSTDNRLTPDKTNTPEGEKGIIPKEGEGEKKIIPKEGEGIPKEGEGIPKENPVVLDLEKKLALAKKNGNKKQVGEYKVDIAKEKRKLKNAFGLFGRKDKSRYDKKTQDSMRANYNKAKKDLNSEKDPAERKRLENVMKENHRLEQIQRDVSVTMPDGSKQVMTNDEAQAMLTDNEATHISGRKNTSDRRGIRTKRGKYYTSSPATARQTILGSSFKRKNSQGNSPYSYKERIDENTPFYQVDDYDPSTTEQEPPVEEETLQGGELPEVVIEGNTFDLMKRVGPIDSKEWVAEAALIGDEKPPQLLGAPAILGITEFMKTQKDALDKIKKNKGSDADGMAIINNVRSLSVNMNKVGTFITDNMEAIEGGNESKGSSMATSYLRDIVLTQKTDEEGKPLTTMMVDNNNELAIKFAGTKGVHSLKTLKKDIFPKAYNVFETLAKGFASIKEEATSGAPFNTNAATALINNAIKNEQHVLSVIHDDESPLSNFMNDFAEHYPSANSDFAIIDSPSYSSEDLEPLVKDYALMKLKAQHALYSKQDSQPSQIAQDIIAKYSK